MQARWQIVQLNGNIESPSNTILKVYFSILHFKSISERTYCISDVLFPQLSHMMDAYIGSHHTSVLSAMAPYASIQIERKPPGLWSGGLEHGQNNRAHPPTRYQTPGPFYHLHNMSSHVVCWRKGHSRTKKKGWKCWLLVGATAHPSPRIKKNNDPTEHAG